MVLAPGPLMGRYAGRADRPVRKEAERGRKVGSIWEGAERIPRAADLVTCRDLRDRTRTRRAHRSRPRRSGAVDERQREHHQYRDKDHDEHRGIASVRHHVRQRCAQWLALQPQYHRRTEGQDGPDDEVICFLSTNTLSLERKSGKSTFTNVSADLLFITITVDPTTNAALASCLTLTATTQVTLSLFNGCLQNYFWNYDNQGLKLLQLRFYPAPVVLP